LKKNLIKKLVALSLLSNVAYSETTNNLVSQDFTTGWTNTGNTYHGSTTIAGVHNGTVESDSVSLADDVGLNKNEINQGFTVNSSANVWFWNNYDQSITMTTKAIDDNGQTITQNRTLSGTCATWNGCGYGSMTDTMVFNSNTQADYNLSLGFSFSVPSYPSGHYAADLKDPSMTVTYTPINIDSAVESQLVDLSKDINEDIKFENTVDFKEEVKLDTSSAVKEEPTLETFTTSNEPVETVSNETDTNELNDNKETVDSEPKEELNEQTEQKEESNSETSESSNVSTEKDSQQKEVQSKENKEGTNITASGVQVESKVAKIENTLKKENLIKLNLMVDNSLFQQYNNIPFYKEKKIYENQINIRDNRVLYNSKTLVSYTQRDPIFKKESELYNIKIQKQKLINEINILKNG